MITTVVPDSEALFCPVGCVWENSAARSGLAVWFETWFAPFLIFEDRQLRRAWCELWNEIHENSRS